MSLNLENGFKQRYTAQVFFLRVVACAFSFSLWQCLTTGLIKASRLACLCIRVYSSSCNCRSLITKLGYCNDKLVIPKSVRARMYDFVMYLVFMFPEFLAGNSFRFLAQLKRCLFKNEVGDGYTTCFVH